MPLFESAFKPAPRRGTTPKARVPFRPRLEALETRLCPAADIARPTILTLNPSGTSQVSMTWTDVQNETGYHVLRWDGTQTVTVATLAADTTSYTVTGLPAGQRVWLRVEAFNTTQSAMSLWGSVNMPVQPLTPATGLTATAASATEVDLNWTDAQGETGYHVFQWNGSRANLVDTVAAGKHSDAITGLTPGTTYYFALEAFNDSNSAVTNWISVSTPAQPIAAPTNLTLTPTGTSVSMSWTASQGATGYKVYQWDGSKAVLLGEVDSGTTFTATGLKPGTNYWFYVQAFNASNSASTAWTMATTTAPPPPAAPGNVKATLVGPGQVKLDWDTATGADGYRVYHWTGTAWEVLATLPASAKTTTVGGFAAGKKQWFVVMSFTSGFAQYAVSPYVSITT
jgi:hypothetical protein